MVLTRLARVLVGLVDYDDGMIFDKLHSYGNRLLHPSKGLANGIAAILVVLSCLYQDDLPEEWYGPIATLLDNMVLEAPVVQLPNHWNSDVAATTVCITNHLFHRMVGWLHQDCLSQPFLSSSV